MIKKLFSISAVAVMLMSTTTFAAEQYEDKLEILNSLKITDEVKTSKETVTVNEFLYSVANLLSEEHIEVDKAAKYLMDEAVIGSMSDKELYKDILFEQAAEIAVNVAGYTPYVNRIADSGDENLRVAHQVGILDGVTGNKGNALAMPEFIDMMFNLTEIEMPEMNIGSTGAIYSIDKDRTMLSYNKNIGIIEGVVNATYNTALDGDRVRDGEILIGDTVFSIPDSYDSELLGCTVKAYVYDLYGENTVLCLLPDDDTQFVEVNADDIVEVEKDFGYIEYEIENQVKTKKIKLDPAFDVIYNGRFYDGYTAEDLIPDEGAIKAVDTDGDEIYEIVHVTAYENMIVQNISTIYKYIQNKYTYKGALDKLDLSDEDITLTVYKNGEKTTLGGILPNDVLSIARSRDEEPLVTIYASNATVEGRMLHKDEDEKTVSVGEEEYGISSLYFDAMEGNDRMFVEFSYTMEQVFYLDAFGKVAYVSAVKNNGFKYGYLLKLKPDDFEEQFFMRVLKENGEWETLTMNDKVKLDSETSIKSKSAYERLGGLGCQPQLIMYKVNSENLVNAIKTAGQYNGYEPNKFTGTTWTKRQWKPQSRALESVHYVKDDCIVFVVPDDSQYKYDEEEYKVDGAGFFAEWRSYTYCAYNIDLFYTPDAFVSYEPPEQSAETLFYVNEIDTVVNDDNEAVMRIRGDLAGGIGNLTIAEKEYGIIEKAGIKRGQVIRIKLNGDKLVKAEIAFDGSERIISNPTNYHNTISYMGYAKEIDTVNSKILMDFKSQGERVLAINASAMYEIYDDEKKEFVNGSLSDIEKGDYVILLSSNSNVSGVIVYKD